MDVAMSISSAMKEIYDQNHQITRMQLVKAGMRVGRDMMGTDSNTLILLCRQQYFHADHGLCLSSSLSSDY